MSPIDNPYYTSAVHGPFELADIGDLILEDGQTLRHCQLAYQTLGQLNEARDNAILIPSWFSGTHGVMRDVYVGPGRAIDPQEYFVVLVNQIGSGLGTSPHNLAGPYGQGQFPHVRVGDDVAAQDRLLRETLGVDELALVFGASMGAQQTYEWAVRFPDRVKRAAPLAGTAQALPHQQIWVQTMTEALLSDPAYNGGWYTHSDDIRAGLSRLATLFALHLLPNQFWHGQNWRGLGFSSPQDFVSGFLLASLQPMDAGDLLAQMWKWKHADVARHGDGNLGAALRRVTAETIVMSISTDPVFPPADCRADQMHIAGSQLRIIDDAHGHAALYALTPTYSKQIDAALRELLATTTL